MPTMAKYGTIATLFSLLLTLLERFADLLILAHALLMNSSFTLASESMTVRLDQ